MMSDNPPLSIVIVGSGLAASLCALTLSNKLGLDCQINLITSASPSCSESDALFGGITSPDAYQHNYQLGISEPEIMLQSNSAFAFGNKYQQWGKNQLQWLQCFHLPFPSPAGVDFHHYITRHNEHLEDYLISAQAAHQGRFAHPPEDKPNSALARAEYGYQFEPEQWAKLYLSKLDKQKVTIHQGELTHISLDQQNNIESIELNNEQSIKGDLFIDCTGSSAQLLTALSAKFIQKKEIYVRHDEQTITNIGPSYRAVTGLNNGWKATSSLQNKEINLTLLEADTYTGASFADGYQSVKTGHHQSAWLNNCVSLGFSAAVIEPLTPAPYILLNRDINRLLELMPVSNEMALERDEYNRRYLDDYHHALLFHDAITYVSFDDIPADNIKLRRKVEQFLHRGILANYDFEPFNNEDWIILHFGIGRRPSKYIKMADQLDNDTMKSNLANMRNGIAHLTAQLPKHHDYVCNFLAFLRKKYDLSQ